MLSRTDVLRLLATEQPLPQAEQPEIPDNVVAVLQAETPHLIQRVIDSSAVSTDAEEHARAVFSEIHRLAGLHGWYPASVVLSMSLAYHFSDADVPTLPGLSDDSADLLRSFARAARTATDSGAEFTIPVARLTSMGERGALEFTGCVAFCAGFGEAKKAGVT
jgi:hypothetical protein